MVLQKVLSDIRFNIPVEVLEIAFLGDMGLERKRPGSLDWEIRNKVIDAKVRPDCNLMGALEMNIPLANAEISYDPSGMYRNVARIPKSLTQGRSIVAVNYFNYYFYQGAIGQVGGYMANNYSSNTCGNSPLMQQAGRILSSAANSDATGTAAVRLIGENTICVNDYIGSLTQGSVVCLVAHDSEMNSILPSAIPQFSTLCELATKAYIYNNLRVRLNSGYINGGTELGEIQNAVESYSDAAESYKEYLTNEWYAVQFANDDTRYSWLLRNMIGGAS